MQTLYIVDSNWSESAVEAAYASLLPGERHRVDRMCAAGRAQLTISQFVRRPLLAEATGLSDLAFKRDAKGKLSLAADPGWFFNVADTPGCVALGVSRHAIGVDVEEKSRSIINLDDFVSACLSPREQLIVSGLADIEKKNWVLRAWVLKEAYTKRLGLGLSFGFQRISVNPEMVPPTLFVEDECSEKGGGSLLLWTEYLDHYIALSVEENVTDITIRVKNEHDFII